MDERIITLREQAEKFATDSVPYFRGEIGGVWEQEFNRVRDEKFAEFIVKECIAIYDDYADHSGDPTYFRLARHNVKKTFGVE